MDPLGLFTIVPTNRPAQPVVTTNFTLAYNQATGQVTLTEVIAPASTYPVTSYVIRISGVSTPIFVDASQLPYSFDFTPALFPGIWKFQAASWNVAMTITARSQSGDSVASDPVSVAIAQSSVGGGMAYFVPTWTYLEETDQVAANSIVGRQKASVPNFTVPSGYELRWYSGALAYNSGNLEIIHSLDNTIPITPGSAAILTPNGFSVGSTVNGILLYYHAVSNVWFPASLGKLITIAGLAVAGAPVFTVDPALTGTTVVDGETRAVLGNVLTATYTATGETLSPLYQWLSGGAAISGATGSTYTTVAGDDQAQISVRITPRNASGSAVARTSPAVPCKYAKPALSGTIADITVDQEANAYQAQAISGFTGSNLTYSRVAGNAAVRINPQNTGLIVNLSSAVAANTVTIRATNSGGSVDQTFTLTIAAHAATIPDWPADITTAAFSEVTSASEATSNGFAGEDGHIKLVMGAATVAPTGYQLVMDLLSGEIGTPYGLPNVAQNTTYYSSGKFAKGDTVRPKLYWKHIATGLYKIAYNPAAITIQGLGSGPVVTGWPQMGNLGTAAGQAGYYPMENWGTNSSGPTNANTSGIPTFAFGYAVWAGQNTYDATFIARLRNGFTTGGPALAMGFIAQHDLPYVAAVALASKISRIWSQFSSTEKANFDLFMRAALVAAAGGCREAGVADGFSTNLMGGVNPSSAGGGPNIRTAHAAIVMACCWYFGLAAAKAYLDSVIVDDLATELAGSVWTNAAVSFRKTGRPSGAPTLLQLQNHCRGGTATSNGWTRWGHSILNPDRIWNAEIMGQSTPSAIKGGMTNPCQLAYNAIDGGASAGLTVKDVDDSAEGWAVNTARVKDFAGARADARWLSIRGKPGCVTEFRTKDNGGIRSSGSYSEWSLRVCLIYTLVGFMSGYLDPKSGFAAAAKDNILTGGLMHNIITDYGYLSVAHLSLKKETAAGSKSAYKSGSDGSNGPNGTGGWSMETHKTSYGLLFNHEYAEIIRGVYNM